MVEYSSMRPVGVRKPRAPSSRKSPFSYLRYSSSYCPNTRSFNSGNVMSQPRTGARSDVRKSSTLRHF